MNGTRAGWSEPIHLAREAGLWRSDKG